VSEPLLDALRADSTASIRRPAIVAAAAARSPMPAETGGENPASGQIAARSAGAHLDERLVRACTIALAAE